MIKRSCYVKKGYDTLAFVFLLLGLGLVMVFSTSAFKAELMFENPAYWFLRQSLWAFLGSGVMLGISRLDYRKIYERKRLFYLMYFFMSLLLVLTLILGSVTKGSKRWLALGPFSFQPSELSKLIIILFLARFLSVHDSLSKSMKGIFLALFVTIPIIGPVAIENASTSIILLGIVGVMIFASSPWYKRFFFMILAGAFSIVGIIGSRAYRLERFVIWMDPENHEKGYQTVQGLYAIGSGGLFGKGLGNSMQKLGFLPEPQNDMIFSVLCEELGLVGAVFVVLLFVCLIGSIIKTGMDCGDLFGFLICIGIAAHLGIQVLINVSVVTNTIPNTGIPLPFISYGGSSLFFLMAEMGLVLSVAFHSRKRVIFCKKE